MLPKFLKNISKEKRLKRGRLFIEKLNLKPGDKILDLGGGTGSHLSSILPANHQFEIYVADVMPQFLEIARKNGFKTIQLNESGKLPIEDKFFDAVFCNSVIEHVTIDKRLFYKMTSTKEFEDISYKHQMDFASEIRRISKQYFVQTPNKYFIIEPHSWFPNVFIFLSRKNQIRLLNLLNKVWFTKPVPEWNLLTANQMNELFPNSEIVKEKSLGLTKSFIAIQS